MQKRGLGERKIEVIVKKQKKCWGGGAGKVWSGWW